MINPNGVAVAAGFFDGVHLGHAKLISSAKQAARERGLPLCALSFLSHPDDLKNGRPTPLICEADERARLLTEAGADDVILLPFGRRMMDTPWDNFIEQTLIGQLNTRHVAVGADFRFGKGAAGNAALLADFCAQRGVTCQIVDKLELDGAEVSSSRIRAHVIAGNMSAAARLLGRPHFISGEVGHGRGIGRKIGAPTANLPLPEGVCLPPYGVYVSELEYNGRRLPAVSNIGQKPTFGAGPPALETHVLSGPAELYGEQVRVYLLEYLRPEKVFDNEMGLKSAIDTDIAAARRYFKAVD